MSADQYLLEDVLQPGLKVVFCGTALGRVSHAKKAYYANPRNLFWATLHQLGITPELLSPSDYRRALEYGVGLTDLCKTAFGNDHELPKAGFDIDGLRAKIETFRPRILAFTSQKGGRTFLGPKIEFGWQQSPFAATRIYVLPSTSPAARWNWKNNELHWRKLAEAVRAITK
jgi:TDG/mug DNA glycosylase family protein